MISSWKEELLVTFLICLIIAIIILVISAKRWFAPRGNTADSLAPYLHQSADGVILYMLACDPAIKHCFLKLADNDLRLVEKALWIRFHRSCDPYIGASIMTWMKSLHTYKGRILLDRWEALEWALIGSRHDEQSYLERIKFCHEAACSLRCGALPRQVQYCLFETILRIVYGLDCVEAAYFTEHMSLYLRLFRLSSFQSSGNSIRCLETKSWEETFAKILLERTLTFIPTSDNVTDLRFLLLYLPKICIHLHLHDQAESILSSTQFSELRVEVLGPLQSVQRLGDDVKLLRQSAQIGLREWQVHGAVHLLERFVDSGVVEMDSFPIAEKREAFFLLGQMLKEVSNHESAARCFTKAQALLKAETSAAVNNVASGFRYLGLVLWAKREAIGDESLARKCFAIKEGYETNIKFITASSTGPFSEYEMVRNSCERFDLNDVRGLRFALGQLQCRILHLESLLLLGEEIEYSSLE